jgi:hypothetical protein
VIAADHVAGEFDLAFDVVDHPLPAALRAHVGTVNLTISKPHNRLTVSSLSY